jgi:hypothetical protein
MRQQTSSASAGTIVLVLRNQRSRVGAASAVDERELQLQPGILLNTTVKSQPVFGLKWA